MTKIIKHGKISNNILERIFTPRNIIVALVFVFLYNIYMVEKVKGHYIYEWWSVFNGAKYIKGRESNFNLSNYVYMGYAPSWLYHLNDLFIPAEAIISQEEYNAYQTLIFSKFRTTPIRAIDNSYTSDIEAYVPNPYLSALNCVTPYNLFVSIAIGPDQRDWFRGAIIGLYGLRDIKPGWYNEWVKKGMPGPNDSVWSRIMGNTNCRGFWPSDNDCRKFFAAPGKTSSYPITWNTCPANYDTTGHIADSHLMNPQANELAFYQPGNPNCLGSWAQLFADWGCIYIHSTKGPGGTTVTYDWAETKKGPEYENQWAVSSSWSRDKNTAILGLNFFGVYGFLKESTSMIGWVVDSAASISGQTLDPSIIPNWLSPLSGQNTYGGWVHELRSQSEGGSGTTMHDITNKLFVKVSQSVTKCVPPAPAAGAASITKWVSVALGIGATIALVGAPEFAPALMPVLSMTGLSMLPGAVADVATPKGSKCSPEGPVI